ncbi:MAG TPA: PAS domain S-box protein [Chitinophagaceae bacterium]|nr:PAS domain S-box protein [Chitinophagaceae bacterium]
MRTNSSAKKNSKPILSVSHKTGGEMSDLLHHLPDAVIITDLSFNITGWNDAAEKLHGLPGARGKNLFQLIKIDLLDSSIETVNAELLKKGTWEGEVIFHRHDGEKYIFKTSATSILDDNNKPLSIIFVNHNITKVKSTEKKLAEAEATYEKLVNTLVDGVIMLDKDGKVTTCNKRASAILGTNEVELLGKELGDSSWNAIKEDGTPFPWYEFPTVVSLQTGFPQRNVKMGVNLPNGLFVWLLINSEALIRNGEFDPYAVVISFSDITDSVNREEELRRSNERFFYVSKITSDAIWDIDLATKQIYRSETFYELSGYSREEIKPDLDWWFNKIHPRDRERVKNKVQEHIQYGHEKWEDEYLFLCADGSYKFLLDSGTILIRHGKPVRILGAIRDLTEKKKLEQQLLQEQEHKHKAVSQAGIAAQETERSNISRELHDNVNQLLMSAKLFMNSAQTDPQKANEHIEKAITYQLMAVEEIRKLSKTLNTSLVKVIGLSRSIDDIIINMKAFQQIETRFQYDQKLDKLLSDDQKLMIFRILQEQTNNIIKYANAKNVLITLKEENNKISLSITDDGKGFDASIQSKGIGFINIYNRVDAFGGDMELISSPGNGCSLRINFPLILN